MRTAIKYAAAFFTGVLLVSIACSGCSGQSSENTARASTERPMLSKAEMAFEAIQVQNTYSRHSYYHSYPHLYCQELEDIWVKPDGPYGETATWRNAQGIWAGMEKIKDWYCTATMENLKKQLAAISEVYPEIANVPENLGAGSGYTIHTQTTPIIEVAGDGKTAKGLWYSPGIMTNAVIVDGSVETNGGWFFEKYAVDFVKEDGEWKIWHIGMYYDPTPPGWGVESELDMTAGSAEIAELMAPSRPNPDPYEVWSPRSVLKLEPRFPEPYYTFSETFSY